MNMTLGKALGALGIAVAFVCAAPAAHSSSKKKTPTPAAETASTKSDSSDKAKAGKVNLNTADEKDIAAAKGVGGKLAKALVAGRPYKTWDDVSKVKGVGTGKKLDSLKKVLKITDGVAAKDETAATETKGRKTKSSSKGDAATSATAGTGATAGSAAAGSAGASSAAGGRSASTGNTSAATPASSPSKKSSSSSSSKLAPGEMININTASAEELDRLPEIGPTKAKAIVDYREEHGKFASIEDIMKVSGIKEKTFGKIKDHIVVK